MKTKIILLVMVFVMFSGNINAKTLKMKIGNNNDVKKISTDISINTDYIIRTNLSTCNNCLYIYEMNVAGVQEDNIVIKIINKDIMTVSINRKIPKEFKNNKFKLLENKYGVFERSFTLPRDINIDKIETSVKKGMLYITFPIKKKEEINKIKTIKI